MPKVIVSAIEDRLHMSAKTLDAQVPNIAEADAQVKTVSPPLR